MAKIIKVEQTVPTIKTKKKVAAYARVSMESERMNHSLSAQISYYSTLIQKNPDWQYAGVFADDGISGTSIEKRDEFKRMIAAAEKGDIDIILTKSNSAVCAQYGGFAGDGTALERYRCRGAVRKRAHQFHGRRWRIDADYPCVLRPGGKSQHFRKCKVGYAQTL